MPAFEAAKPSELTLLGGDADEKRNLGGDRRSSALGTQGQTLHAGTGIRAGRGLCKDDLRRRKRTESDASRKYRKTLFVPLDFHGLSAVRRIPHIAGHRRRTEGIPASVSPAEGGVVKNHRRLPFRL